MAAAAACLPAADRHGLLLLSLLLLLLLLLLLPLCLPGAANSSALSSILTRKLNSMPSPNVMPKPMALCSTADIRT
jgi:hypothetical protein